MPTIDEIKKKIDSGNIITAENLIRESLESLGNKKDLTYYEIKNTEVSLNIKKGKDFYNQAELIIDEVINNTPDNDIEYKSIRLRAFDTLSFIHLNQRNYEAAIEASTKALDICNDLNEPIFKYEIKLLCALRKTGDKGDIEKALKLAENRYSEIIENDQFKNNDFKKLSAAANYSQEIYLGYIEKAYIEPHNKQSHLEIANEFAQRNLGINVTLGNNKKIIQTLERLCKINYLLSLDKTNSEELKKTKQEEVILYFNQLLKIIERVETKDSIYKINNAYIHAAAAYIKLGDKDNALKCVEFLENKNQLSAANLRGNYEVHFGNVEKGLEILFSDFEYTKKVHSLLNIKFALEENYIKKPSDFLKTKIENYNEKITKYLENGQLDVNNFNGLFISQRDLEKSKYHKNPKNSIADEFIDKALEKITFFLVKTFARPERYIKLIELKDCAKTNEQKSCLTFGGNN